MKEAHAGICARFFARVRTLNLLSVSDQPEHELQTVGISGSQTAMDENWSAAKVTYWGVAGFIAGVGAHRGCYVNERRMAAETRVRSEATQSHRRPLQKEPGPPPSNRDLGHHPRLDSVTFDATETPSLGERWRHRGPTLIPAQTSRPISRRSAEPPPGFASRTRG